MMSRQRHRVKQDTLAIHLARDRLFFVLYISEPFVSVIFSRMVFCKIVSIVVSSFIPEEKKLLLGLPVSQPIVSHIPRI